jgi:hypothetical protein
MSDKLITAGESLDPLGFIENPSPDALQAVLAEGNLAKLSSEQRLQFLAAVCKSVGLNILTSPFQFMTLNGKIRLYATRDCTDQLRAKHNVSIKIVDRSHISDILCVTAAASMPNGRTDESIGAVTIKGLVGEALANSLMKAETKSKRRVTLSICGLGFIDESEVEDARLAEKQMAEHNRPPRPEAEGMAPLEMEVVTDESAPPRHWSDLLIENAYNLVKFETGEWAGKALWEVAKDKADYQKAFESVPRDDSAIRHALDARYYMNLKKRLADKGYDEPAGEAALREAGFLNADEGLHAVPGELLLELNTAIKELPEAKTKA